MLYIRDLIRKKKEGKELTEEEIEFFISTYNRDEILKEQAAALLILMNIKGMSEREMSFLSNAMAKSGEKIELFELSNQITDIHPIGGMDDKIVISLLAIISALGLPSFKIIGREIGIIDKLLQAEIHTFDNNNKEQLKSLINNNIITLIKEPENIAPVENKLYKLRNDIACNDDISIIAINLMSQKIAIGIKNVVFDISYGEKAYVKKLIDAQKLSKILIKIGNNVGINVRCIITKLDEPVGKYFGNTLELLEALEALNGKMESDVKDLILELGDKIIELETGSKNSKNNKQRIMEVIENRTAYDKLLELTVKNSENDITKAKISIPIMAEESGYVEGIDMSIIRTTAQYLNAIRHKDDDLIDIGSGIKFCKKLGDKVETGEIMGYIYTNDETKIQMAVSNVKEAFYLTDKKINKKSRIVEIL